jgi:hypothetical protein
MSSGLADEAFQGAMKRFLTSAKNTEWLLFSVLWLAEDTLLVSPRV